MQNEFQERRRKSGDVAKTIYNLSFGIIIIVVGLVMLFLNVINNDVLNGYIGDMDPLLRYLFGGICLLYGGFRLYRGIQKDY